MLWEAPDFYLNYVWTLGRWPTVFSQEVTWHLHLDTECVISCDMKKSKKAKNMLRFQSEISLVSNTLAYDTFHMSHQLFTAWGPWSRFHFTASCLKLCGLWSLLSSLFLRNGIWNLVVKEYYSSATYMFCGIRQLLLNPFHDLPEGGSVEGVRIPAGPHNLIPAQQHTDTQTPLLVFSYYILFLFFARVCILFSVLSSTMSAFVILVKSQMQQEESGLLFKPPVLHSL